MEGSKFVPLTTQMSVNFVTLHSNIFGLFECITFKLSKLPKALFPALSIDIRLLVSIKSLKKPWKGLFLHRDHGSIYVSRKLPTYPSPKPTLTLTLHSGQNADLGKG